jgi:predicted amidophosphoribosyltransferase
MMRAMARDPSRCPNCGERVLPLAAGCAICGADLDTTRFDRGPSLLQRAGSWFGAMSFGPRVSGATLVAVLVVGYLLLQFL